MKQNEILETIDCTPTWEALLIPMLSLYVQFNERKGYFSNEQKRADLRTEFEKMAIAADKWNAHVKSL